MMPKTSRDISLLTLDRLKSLLHYDPETGVFTRLVQTASNTKVNERAGSLKIYGYRYISVDSIRYREHRLAWFYMTEEWPRDQIDHVNGRRDDNRWSNLRSANNKNNTANAARRRDNKTGAKGLRKKRGGKWEVSASHSDLANSPYVKEWFGKTPDSAVPPRVRLRVFDKYDGRCPECSRLLVPGKWDLDHIIPLINGGLNREANLWPVCRSPCHSQKTVKDVAEKARNARKRRKHLGIKRPHRTIPGRKFDGTAIPARFK